MNKKKADLLRETLLWIESISSLEADFISTHSPVYGFEYGEEELEQYFLSKRFYFHRWSRIFHRNRIRRDRIINIDGKSIMQQIKLKCYFQRWRRVKMEIYSRYTCVTPSALQYLFKKRLCFLYWAMKSKFRRSIKFRFLKRWVFRFVQKKLLLKGFGILRHLKLMDAFKRWHRRSRWPAVKLQRRFWQKRAAFSSIKLVYLSRTKSHGLIVIAVRHLFRASLNEWLYRHARVQSWKTLGNNMSRKHSYRFVLQWIGCFKDRNGFRLCETACRRFHDRRRLRQYFHSLRSNRRRDLRVAVLLALRRLFGKFRQQLRVTSAIRNAGEGRTSLSSLSFRKSRFVELKRQCDQRRVRRRSLISASLTARRLLLRSALFALSQRLVRIELRGRINNFLELKRKRRVFHTLCQRLFLRMQLQNIIFYCRCSRSLWQFVHRIDVLAAMRASTARGAVRYEVKVTQQCLQRWRATSSGRATRRLRFRYFRQLHPHPLLPYQLLLEPGTVQTGVRAVLGRIFIAWKELMPYFRHIKMAKRVIRFNRKQVLLDNSFDSWCYAFDMSMRRCRLARTGFDLFRRRIVFLKQYREKILSSIHSSASTVEAGVNHNNGDSFQLVLRHLSMTESRHNISWMLIGHCRCMWRIFTTWRNSLRRLKRISIEQMRLKRVVLQELEGMHLKRRAVSLRSQRWIVWRAMRAWFDIVRSRMDKLITLEARVLGRKYFQHWLVRCKIRMTARHMSRSDLEALSTTSSSARLSSIKQRAEHRRKQAAVLATSTSRSVSMTGISLSFDTVSKQRSGFHQRIQVAGGGGGDCVKSSDSSSFEALTKRRGQGRSSISICDDITSVDFNRRSYTGQFLWKKLNS